MTTPPTVSILALNALISKVSAMPQADLRYVAILGLARTLPQDEEEVVSLAGLPFLEGIQCTETDLPRGRFFDAGKMALEIDPRQQLPRHEFYGLVEAVANIEDDAAREAALFHVVMCTISTPGWVAW